MPAPAFSLRRADQADIPRLCELFAESGDFHAALDPRFAEGAHGQAEAREQFEKWLAGPKSVVIVAEKNGTVVGLGVGAHQPPNPATAPVPTGKLDEMVVSADCRRQGIGEAITNALLDWFRAQGLQRVVVGMGAKNPVSMAFWQKMGFEDWVVLRTRDI